VLYDSDYEFAYGRGYRVLSSPADRATIVSSGRGVHEAIAAAKQCAAAAIPVGVVDMPSIDQQLLLELNNCGQILVLAEQNNGYIWQNFLKILYWRGESAGQVVTINTLNDHGQPQFIHSGTYEELTDAFDLNAAGIARVIQQRLGQERLEQK
jgi:transketolase